MRDTHSILIQKLESEDLGTDDKSININLEETMCVEWVHLAQDRDLFIYLLHIHFIDPIFVHRRVNMKHVRKCKLHNATWSNNILTNTKMSHGFKQYAYRCGLTH
jgi:hypothetical protein